MGSYNVACSVSNLSISSGTEVAFFLLLPNCRPWGYSRSLGKDQFDHQDDRSLEKIHRVGIHTHLMYSNCYFNPLALPIFAEYNDYGGLECIEEDANTRALEKFFGLSIEKIVEIVCCHREVTCTLSAAHKILGISGEKEFDFSGKFDGKYLESFGFKKQLNGRYALIKKDHTEVYKTWQIELTEPKEKEKGHPYMDHGFRLYKTGIPAGEELLAECDGRDARKQLQKFYLRHVGYYLNVPEDMQDRFKVLCKLSGMFVIKDVYDDLARYVPTDSWSEVTVADSRPSESILKELNFELISEDPNPKERYNKRWHRKGNDKLALITDDSGYSYVEIVKTGDRQRAGALKRIKKTWEELSSQTVDISKYETIPLHGQKFEDFSKKVNAYDSKTSQEKFDMLLLSGPFSTWGAESYDTFYVYYKDWSFFEKLYRNQIKECNQEIKQKFINQYRFEHMMYGCNKFYFPAMNGPQCGEPEEETYLLKSSLKFLEKQKLEREEWD